MPRWTIVVAGTIGVAAVVGHVLFAPVPGSTAPTPEPSRPPAASAPITPIPAEMPMLRSALPFSAAEENLLVGWQDPPAWDSRTGQEAEPPGRGHFLVKVGGKPGIPVRVWLTSVEAGLNDTNKRWHEQSRIGSAEGSR